MTIPYPRESDAIHIANDSPFGQSGQVTGGDLALRGACAPVTPFSMARFMIRMRRLVGINSTESLERGSSRALISLRRPMLFRVTGPGRWHRFFAQPAAAQGPRF